MAFLLGTDEAGYGPNLGPLVIAGTRWQVPDVGIDLFQSLSEAIGTDRAVGQVWVGDSKQAGVGARGLARLEIGVLSLAAALRGSCPSSPRELFESFGHPYPESGDWFDGGTIQLPLFNDRTTIEACTGQLCRAWAASQCQLEQIRIRVIEPAEFNQLVDRVGNKANLLTAESLDLAKQLLPLSGDDQVRVICDKHGGRKHYAGWLQERISGGLVQVELESPRRSDYRWQHGAGTCEFRFCADGETHLPVAVASMTAKYVRELAMFAWNRYWQAEIPELRPTKGYPADARRFKRDIARRQAELGIDDRQIWRDC